MEVTKETHELDTKLPPGGVNGLGIDSGATVIHMENGIWL